MDKFNFEDYMDMGCPSCGAEANEDCFEDCAGIPVPPQMWGFVEEQMAFVTHKVAQRLMKQFKMKIFTEKLEDIMEDLSDFKGFATLPIIGNVANPPNNFIKVRLSITLIHP